MTEKADTLCCGCGCPKSKHSDDECECGDCMGFTDEPNDPPNCADSFAENH